MKLVLIVLGYIALFFLAVACTAHVILKGLR
jgi:hypothetical protein